MDMKVVSERYLHQLFEAQVDRNPAHLAIICGEKHLSYKQLEQRANQLAHRLRSLGVGPGQLIGIYCFRSEIPIIAVLATLKAGAAYVPLDPVYPNERCSHILAEANVSVLLSENQLQEKASSFFSGPILLLDNNKEQLILNSEHRISNRETGLKPADLCYVLYTSGTTGQPKGVMTEHRNVVAFVSSFNDVCQIEPYDRIYQGFSLVFDGSVEEIWMAFAHGATLVIGPPEVTRLGNETAHLITKESVSFFSTVPTFLSMITVDLPSVRLLIVSGEPCTTDLVTKWSTPERRMLNVYGPTETTVNTTVAECVANQPITIGRPIPGYQTYILNAEKKPVSPGETGELYIGGAGVARGYFNKPELTEAHFVPNPFGAEDYSSRLYRTGDLVRTAAHDNIEFLGRIDRQVKIRGFRIELSEIETVLRNTPGVDAAVVTVYKHDDLKELAAYVVPTDSATKNVSIDRDEILTALQEKLPPYMVPAYLEILNELPTLASGKVDHKRLPTPATPLILTNRKIVLPRNETETQLVKIFEKVFKISPVSITDNFFHDLGGYSLIAAEFVSELRKVQSFEVNIRDLYANPTVEQLAVAIASKAEADASSTINSQENKDFYRESSKQVYQRLPRLTRWACVGLQSLTLYLLYGLFSLPILIPFWLLFQSNLPLLTVVWGTLIVFLATGPVLMLTSILAKWAIIGRYKPGKYPLWGMYYLRWWVVTRLQSLSGIGLLSGTPVMSLYYRLMGAKIGRNCIIDTPLCAIHDLLVIGDDSSIGAETQLLGYHVEDGYLVIDNIEIGSRCFIGTHCMLGINSCMGNDSRLDDLSLLAAGETINAGEARQGSPSQPAKVTVPTFEEQHTAKKRPFLYGLYHYITAELLVLFVLFTTVPIIIINAMVYFAAGLSWAIVSLFLTFPLGIISFCLMTAAIKRLILPDVKPGVYSVESGFYLRKWFIDSLFNFSRTYVRPLFTTIYLPAWLRMLGAKVGARAEISTISQMTPDLTIIDEESFFADGSIIGGRRFFRGHVQFAVNHIGRRSFIGNNAMLPVGENLANQSLLGVLSVPPITPEGKMPDGSEWLGSPSFQLPYRKKASGFDISQTYTPTKELFRQRYLIDAIRIVLPSFIIAAATIVYFLVVSLIFSELGLWPSLLLVPIVALGTAIAAALCVVVIKKLLMGRFEPVIKPLWSRYVWWNEVVNGAYESVGAPALAPMMGTPFYSWYLRLMGCKIGKHTFIETSLFSEFDLVEIGDYAALNQGVVIQNHLFEDRIMKSSDIKIGDGCSVGNMSVVLYDTEMKPGSSIGPLSLLMKGEVLPASTRWVGIPIVQRSTSNISNKERKIA